MPKKMIVTDISSVNIRPLTRRQMRELKEAKASPAHIDVSNPVAAEEQTEKFVDWVLSKIYPEYDFDDCPNADVVKFASQTYSGAYTTETEAKN